MLNIYIRADCSKDLGFGHVNRCLAFAEMVNEEFNCIFLIKTPTLDIKKKIKKEFTEMQQLKK